MTDVSVTVGTGSFEHFEVLLDNTWPVVPREGEQLLLQTDNDVGVWRVRGIRYVIEQEQMIVAEVLVSRQVAPAALQ